MAADQGFDEGGFPELDLGYEEDPQDAGDAFADQIAERAVQQFREQTDPLLQQQQAAEAEAQATLEAAAVQATGRHPEFQQPAVAQRAVADARRAAADLNRPEWAGDMAFIEAVYEQRQAGVSGDRLGKAIGDQMTKADILTGGRWAAGGSGVGGACLPFGR
jgi:hypothetical protein